LDQTINLNGTNIANYINSDLNQLYEFSAGLYVPATFQALRGWLSPNKRRSLRAPIALLLRSSEANPRDIRAGLLATEGRRSVEPMAVVTDPGHVSTQHQKLLHVVANSPWSDEKMLAKVREQVVSSTTRGGPIEVWIIDDTGFPKKGTHSVGVHHQYCGQLGKQANCQVPIMRACRSPIGSICRASGATMRSAAERRMFRPQTHSRPSRRLHWSRFARL
jgi:hypothetical protein